MDTFLFLPSASYKYDGINNFINNNQSLTLNIKYNLINSKGFDYIKNYKYSDLRTCSYKEIFWVR